MKITSYKNISLVLLLLGSFVTLIDNNAYAKTGATKTKSPPKPVSLKIEPTMNEATRYKLMSPYFSPSFESKLQIDRTTPKNKEVLKAEELEGFIYVNPPTGHCFRINFDPAKPDRNICDRTAVKYHLSDLGDQGKLNWMISVDDSSSQFRYSWDSWYKFAKILPSVKDSYVKEKKYPILNCELNIDERKITLDMFFTKWFIRFPPVDIPAKDYELRYQVEVKEGEAEAEVVTKPQDKLLWTLPEDKSFGLDPDSIKVNDLPGGAVATRCRYLRKTPQSKFNNSLECHHIGLYEVLRLPLDCLEGLKH